MAGQGAGRVVEEDVAVREGIETMEEIRRAKVRLMVRNPEPSSGLDAQEYHGGCAVSFEGTGHRSGDRQRIGD